MAKADGGLPVFVSKDGRWRLEWVDLGEGLFGDFNPGAADDLALLRADLYCRDPKTWEEQPDPGEKWGRPRDSSYCTQAPVGSSRRALKAGAEDLFGQLGSTAHPKRIMERWTWREYPDGPVKGRAP